MSPLVRQVIRDTDWLSRYPTRVVGTPSHDEASAALGDRLDRLARGPGVRVWKHDYRLVVPRVLTATLTLAARGVEPEQVERIYPFWPASVRANSTPEKGIEGQLIYVGKGDYGELLPRSLPGQIAVMEIAGGGRWQNASAFGARAILVLGTPGQTSREACAHLSRLPLNVPRFYLPDGPAADALRVQLAPVAARLRRNEAVPTEDIPRGRLRATVRFESSPARNYYVLVTPNDAAGPLPPAFAVVAAYDSMSVVPELAPGADVAIDTAMALGLLEHCLARRPARPVLFGFVDAMAVNQVGIREMMASLATNDGDRADYVSQDEDLASQYRKDRSLVGQLGRGSDGMDRLWKRDYRSLHRYVKDEIARRVVAIETELYPLRLRVSQAKGAERDRLDATAQQLEDERQACYAAQNQLLTDIPVKPETAERAQQLWNSACDRVEGQTAEAEARLAGHAARSALWADVMDALGRHPRNWTQQQCEQFVENKRLSRPKGDLAKWRQYCLDRMLRKRLDDRAIGFLFGLDLSDEGMLVGPRLFCWQQQLNEAGIARDMIVWLKRIRYENLWPGPEQAVVDLDPVLGEGGADQYIGGATANLTSVSPSWGLPAMTWATLQSLHPRVDTPSDQASRLDWARLAPQIDATARLVNRIVYQTDFNAKPTMPKWTRACGLVVDQSPGEPVPRVPMHGYLTVLVNGTCRGGQMTLATRAIVPGMRLDEYQHTGTDGMFYFDALPAAAMEGRTAFSTYSVQSYQLDESGAIVRAVDLNQAGRGVRLDVNITESAAAPRRALAFSCQEINTVGLFDPRFLMTLPSGTLLDARRGGRPQRMNFTLFEGQMNALMESQADLRWQVLLRAGSTDNRMGLINMMPPDEARGKTAREMLRGFSIYQPLPRTPLEQAALDFYRLDERRLEDYAADGLSSKAINELHAATGRWLEKVEEARAANDGEALFSAASGALSNEIRGYQAVRELANDVVRAAIFLLLALVPFAFAMERLIFASPHVYRQIGGIMAIFTVMTGILWSFHPAFKISSQPLMIIMAFGIIAVSLLVISIIYQRFKSQLEELRSGRAESSGARTSRGGLALSAIRLGIANMRKRKLRTVLTGTTVMLITFALLCFTSVSSYVGHTERTLSTRSSYTGVLIRQPQARPMSGLATDVIRAAVGPDSRVVPQYWMGSPRDRTWRLHVSALPPRATTAATQPTDWTRRHTTLTAALGLSEGEDALSGIDRVLPRWSDFVSAAGGCYLSEDQASKLGVSPGERVVIFGLEIELLGTYTPDQLRPFLTMTGESIMPIDYSKLGDEQQAQLNATDQETLNAEMAAGLGQEVEQQLPAVLPSEAIILPASIIRILPNVSLRSVGVATESFAKARELAEAIADRVAFPVYFGSPDEVHVLAATALAPQGPKSLMIMLVIAGLIIFNTMLNSIAERKKEIHIYSSLGLAPAHIGMLFLAEAATYGLMGSLFGYIVGQGIATGLAKFGLLGGVTLNYSGTQAIATMMMVLAVTLLSALVPAYMAGKLAAPSEHMKWAVPRPENDVICDTLPFTVTPQTASGVVMFLYDYLDAHREGSIGHFSTDNLSLVRPGKTGDVVGVDAMVWLTPYDLGVRQEVRVLIRPAAEAGVLQIDVELRRGSGQVASWWKLNRLFLGDLRKQLLGWRKLKTQRVIDYIAAGTEALGQVPAS